MHLPWVDNASRQLGLLLAGAPLNEPVAMGANIIMNSDQEIVGKAVLKWLGLRLG